MSTSLFSVRRFLIIFSAAWLLLMIDHAILLYNLGWAWQVAAIDSSISNVLLLGFCVLTLNAFRYYMPGLGQMASVVGLCALFTLFCLLIGKFFLELTLDDYEGYTGFLKKSLMVRASLDFLIIGLVMLIAIIWNSWEDVHINESRKTDAEKLAREAELFKLRQQLQPHFLFNSLNSINALIGSRPQEARKMVQQLSDFLRGTIKKEETQWVNLKEEIQYLQLYLEIEKVRFGNRLTTEVNTTDDSLEMKLPALLLQPIVENAIKFGLYDTTGETKIIMSSEVKDNELLVKVSNPFDPETSAPRTGTGFGLQSIKRRLFLLSGRNDLLSTEIKDNIFTTIVKVPVIS